MSLRSRIAALEQQAKGLAIPDSCPTCGGPVPGVNRCVVCDKDGNPIDLANGGKRIQPCPQCGLLPFATAVPARGEVHVKRIILHHGPVERQPTTA